MKTKFIIISILLVSFLTYCTNNPSRKVDINQCILSFTFKKNDAVGPEGLVSIVRINDSTFRKMLLENPQRLNFEFYGGIYNIDSLHFPSPMIDVYNLKGNTIIFEQGIFGLRRYSDSFIDSVMQKTGEEISINVLDTLTKEKWIITRCKEN